MNRLFFFVFAVIPSLGPSWVAKGVIIYCRECKTAVNFQILSLLFFECLRGIILKVIACRMV